MKTDLLRPSTLDGIKRLAKRLHKNEGLQYARALDRAAQLAGFENYPHAQRNIAVTDADFAQPLHAVYLTAYWRDTKAFDEGRETLCVRLPKMWKDLLARHELRICRSLGAFRGQYDDHLVARRLVNGQGRARNLLCQAARELQFMAATGLQPIHDYPAAYPRNANIPGADHQSRWIDRASGLHIVVDEPYESVIRPRQQDREAWAAQRGLHLARAPWPGMYAPDIGSVLDVIAREEDVDRLAPVLARLTKAAAPIMQEGWNGESASYRPVFRSPGEVAAHRRAQAPVDPLNLLDTSTTKVFGYQRRPNASMPVEEHEEIGQILKFGIALTGNRKSVRSLLDRVRSTLDDWLQREEFGRDLDGDRFFAVYYHGAPPPSYSRSISDADKARLLAGIDRIEALLRGHYPECAPRREMIGRLDSAKRATHRWKHT